MKNHLFLGTYNRADIGTFSGGNWNAQLPLTNLKTREQWKVARSTNALAASTKFSIDFGRLVNLRAFALINHNLTQAAAWKILVGTTAGASDIYDSGFQAIWHLSFNEETLEWESDSFWEGIVDDPAEYLGHPYMASHTTPDYLNARYVTIEIVDTANPDGYIQIGRLFSGSGFVPSRNAEVGLKDSWVDDSELVTTDGGYTLAYLKRRRRAVNFMLDHLTEDEGALVHEIQRKLGVFGEVLYLPSLTDQTLNQRYGMMGRLTELSAIDYPRYKTRATGFSIKEL